MANVTVATPTADRHAEACVKLEQAIAVADLIHAHDTGDVTAMRNAAGLLATLLHDVDAVLTERAA